MGVIYARLPDDLKEKLAEYGKSKGLNQGDTLTELVKKGFGVPDLEKQADQLRERQAHCEEESHNLQTEVARMKGEAELAEHRQRDAERAKIHLENLLNIPVGKCTTNGCGLEVTLRDFAFQRCPHGHMNCTDLYPQYKKTPGVGEVLVPSLAIIGIVALASELLGGTGQS